MRTLLVLLCLAGVTGGCAMPAPSSEDADAGSSASALRLTLDRAQYRAGDALVLTLTNGTSERVGYNLCGAALDRRVGGSEWREVQERPAQVCTMELRTLAPGASDTFRHTVPAGLTPGEYRMRTGVESPLGASWVQVASAGFQIG